MANDIKIRIDGDGKPAIRELENVREEVSRVGRALAEETEQSFRRAGRAVADFGQVRREVFRELQSEVLEEIIGDGSIANTLVNAFHRMREGAAAQAAVNQTAASSSRAFAASLGQVSGAALGAAGAVAGVAVGVSALTLVLARQAAELESSSQLIGVNVEQLQRLRTTAELAGSSSDALTNAVKSLGERAREVQRGNLDIAESFAAIGVNASDALRNPTTALEALLRALEQIPDPLTRVAAAERLLGNVSDETARALIALTNNQGELRRELANTAVVMDNETAASLAKLNRDFDQLTNTISVKFKQALVGTVNFFRETNQEWQQLSLNEEAVAFGLDKVTVAQQRNATAMQQGAQATNQQTTALAQLVNQLTAAQAIESAGKVFNETIQAIAVRARNSAEAVKLFKQTLALDDDFNKANSDTQRYADNLKAINEANSPAKITAGSGARRQVLSEYEQMVKRLAEINREIAILQAPGSREFQIRFQVDSAQTFKGQLEDILRLQGELGVSARNLAQATVSAFQRANVPASVARLLAKEAADRQLEILRTLQEQDRLVKQRESQTVIAAELDDSKLRRSETLLILREGLLRRSEQAAEAEKAAAQTIASIYAATVRARQEQAQSELELFVLQNGNNATAVRQRAANQRAALEEELRLIERRTTEQLKANQLEEGEDEQRKERKRAILKAIADQYEAEGERIRAAIRLVNQEEQDALDQLRPSANLFLFDETQAGLTQFQAFQKTIVTSFLEIGRSAQNFRQIVGGALAGVLQGTQQTLAAFILTGRGGGAAFRQLTAEIIAALAVQGGIKAIFEVAEGIAASARYDFVAASQHFAAAKTYGIIAAVAGGIGIGIGAAGGLGGGAQQGGLSQQLTGTRDDQRSTEERVRFRDGQGLERAQTQVVVVVKREAGLRVEVENIARQSYNDGGTFRKLIQNETQGVPID